MKRPNRLYGWLTGNSTHRQSRGRRRALEAGRRLAVEPLEDRRLLSVSDPLQTLADYSLEVNPVAHTSAYSQVIVENTTATALRGSNLADAYPSSFSLVTTGDVTSVKDQGSWGTCWAFAACASLESSILVADNATNDFSERNLACTHGFDWGPNDGGNTYISEAYFSRGSGPIDESDDPYEDMGTADYVTGPVQYYVSEMLRLNAASDIKTALMTYGGVVTAMYMDEWYFNSSNDTYCYNGIDYGSNHEVTIVGWDDAQITDGGAGAWLIKNSWGTGWGDGGYFWLSYQDTVGGKSGVAFCGAVSADTYSNIYYWDDFGDVTELNTPYAFNAFTAESDFALTSVGFFTEADGAAYTVVVYDTYSNGTLSDALATVSGAETYAGYHTIELPSSVSLAAGNDFYVCLQLTDGGEFPMAIDMAWSGYASASTASAGQSYYSFDGTTWTDLTIWQEFSTANFCIKALVQDVSAAPTAVTLLAGSDTGASNTDNLTNLDNSSSTQTLQFQVTGTIAGATVTIYADGLAIGSALAVGAATIVSTNGTADLLDGVHTITARQTESGSSESADSAGLNVVVDTAAPAVVIDRAISQIDPTNVLPIVFTVTFSEAMTGFDATSVTLGGTAPGTLAATVIGSGTTYCVTVTGLTGNGTVAATIAADVIYDDAGNANVASTSTDNAVVYDVTSPTVSAVTPSVRTVADANVGAAAFSLTVTYNAAMNTSVLPTITFPTEDVSSSLTFSSGSWSADGKSYTAVYDVADVSINVANIDVGVSGTQDTLGNPFAVITFDSQFSIDTVNPTVVSVTPNRTSVSDTTGLTLTIVYSEAMDMTVAPTITFPAEAGVILSWNAANSYWSDSATYVAVFDVIDTDTVVENINVALSGAMSSTGNAQDAASLADVFNIDTQNPAVTINQAATQTDPTGGSVVLFTVVFSEVVVDFDGSDVTLVGVPGGAIASVAAVGTDGTTYALTVGGLMDSGTLVATIAAGAVHDAAGNVNLASTSTDNTVAYVCTTIYVTTINDVIDATDGETSLREAINRANAHIGNDTITFAPTLTGETITLNKKLGVLAIVDKTGTTTIEGLGVSNLTISGGGETRVFNIGAGATVVISDLTITEGRAVEHGGAIYNLGTLAISDCTLSNSTVLAAPTVGNGGGIFSSGTLTMIACTLSGNTAASAGGGIYNSGTATVDDSVFSSNIASDVGGGIYNSGSLTVTDSRIRGNHFNSSNPGDYSGAGVYNAGTAAISGSEISNNTALDSGGGVYNAGTMTMAADTVSNNSASAFGGGIYNAGSLTIGESTVSGNNAYSSGGGIYDAGLLTMTCSTVSDNLAYVSGGGAYIAATAAATVTNSTFSANTALFDRPNLTKTGDGGGFENYGLLTVINSTIFGNDALFYGGGIDNRGGTVTVYNSTITANCSATGGGIRNYGADNFALNNTIVAANPSCSSPSPDIYGAVTANYCLIQNPLSATIHGANNVFGVDPLLGALGDHGGLTKTIALLPGSPAINAGSNALVPSGVATDQRGAGFDRIFGGALVDIGAYESSYDALRVTINQAATQVDPTNSSTVYFTVVFGAAVTDFTADDVTISGVTGTSVSVTPVGADETTYTVAVAHIVSDGTVVASIGAGKAHDAAGNVNVASTSDDNSIICDVSSPGVTINQAAGQPEQTKGSPINFTVVFSEAVTDFTASDVTLSGTATGNLLVAVTGSGAMYNVAVSGMAGTGTVIAAIGAGGAHDAVGNGNLASTSADNSVTYDVTAPTVTINQATGQTDPTNGATIYYTVVFSETVTGFNAADVTLAGVAGASVTAVTPVGTGGTTYTVTVTGMYASGTLVATIGADKAYDAAGNANVASTSTDNRVAVDIIAPTVTINQDANQDDSTKSSPINFTVVFSEAVTDFTADDVTLRGTAPGTLVAVVTGSGTTYNVAVGGMTDGGTVIASIAAGVAHDSAGNVNRTSTSTDNIVTYIIGNPSVTVNQAASQADPTNGSIINFTVIFSHAVTGFDSSDVTLGGTAAGTPVAAVTGSGTTYNVAVTGMTGGGTVTAAVAAGKAADAMGNANEASTSADNSVTYDITAPTVTINQAAAQTDPSSTSPINFTVVFSEATTDFAASDVTLGGTAPGTLVATVTGAGTTYNVAVSGMTGSGTVTAALAAGVAHDAAGNASATATSSDNAVLYDMVLPTVLSVTSNLGTVADANVGSATFSLTIVYSEAMDAGTAPTIAFPAENPAGTLTLNATGSGWTSDTTYVATYDVADANALLPNVDVQVAGAKDVAGNVQTQATIANLFNINTQNPAVAITAVTDPVLDIALLTNVAASGTAEAGALVSVVVTDAASHNSNVATTTADSSGNWSVSGLDITSLNDGAVTFTATVTNGVGNVSTASKTAVKDVFAPTITSVSASAPFISPNADGIKDSTTIAYTLSENCTVTIAVYNASNSLVRTLVGSAAKSSGTNTEAWDGKDGSGNHLADGVYTFKIDATDAVAKTASQQSGTVTIDTVGPTVAWGSATPANAAGWNNTDVTVNYAATDALSGMPAGQSTGALVLTAEGSNIAGTVAATDLAGNAATFISPAFKIDKTAPTVTVNLGEGQANPTTGSPINFTVAFSEAVTDFTAADVTLVNTGSGTLVAAVTGTGAVYNVAVSGMAGSGAVTATVAAGKATDVAGNANSQSTSANSTVSYVAGPAISNVSAAATTSAAKTTVGFSVADPTGVTSVGLAVDGKKVSISKKSGDKYFATYAYSGSLLGGTHTYVITAVSSKGTSTYTSTVAVAGTVPAISKVTAKATTSDKTTAFAWSVKDIDGIGAVTLSIDGGAAVTVARKSGSNTSAGYSYAAKLSAGLHTFSIAAVDVAGVNATPYTGSVTVKATAPTVSKATVKTAASDQLTTIAWTVYDIDTIGTVRLTIDKTTTITMTPAQISADRTTASYAYSGAIAAGKHTYVINASDATGMAAKPVSGSFTIKATNPTISTPVVTTTTSANPTTITWDVFDLDGIGTVALTIDNQPATGVVQTGSGVAASFAYAAVLPAGAHSYVITVTDSHMLSSQRSGTFAVAAALAGTMVRATAKTDWLIDYSNAASDSLVNKSVDAVFAAY